MRIALIVPGGVDRSGRERVIPALLWLIERLARRHAVTVVALDQEREPCSYELLGARVVCLGTDDRRPTTGNERWTIEGAIHRSSFRVPRSTFHVPAAGLLRRLARLLAVLEAARPDVLHAFWFGETSTLALLAGRQLGIPVVASVGGGEMVWLAQIGYGGQGNWRGRLHSALALRYTDAITGGSGYGLAPLIQRRPEARRLPLGVETAQFDAPVERPDGPPWRLLHVASINKVKGQITLLHALRIVDQELRNTKMAKDQSPIALDWIGVDTLGGEMQMHCREWGLEDMVRFHGFLPNDAVASLYRSTHLHLISSLHESQCVAVCEAAAAGVPTVGTAVGLLPELSPTAAWSVPVGDARALAAGILDLLCDTARRERMGHMAQQWAQAHDADWTARQCETIYEHVARGAKP